MNTNTLRISLVVLLVSTVLVGTVGATAGYEQTSTDTSLDLVDVGHGFEQTADSDAPTETATGTETAANDSSETAAGDSSEDSSGDSSGDDSDETESVVVEHDSSIRVTEMRYNVESETMYLTLHNRGDRDVSVTITEVIDIEKAEGSRFGLIEPTVRAGETVEVSVSARRFGRAAAVMVTTAESKQQGYGSIVQEDGPATSIFRGEASWTDVRAGVLFTLVVAVFVFVLAAWHVVSQKNEGYSEVALNE